MHQRTRRTATNPLRRDADRARTRLRTAFALACLLAAVCGVLVGRAVWDDGSRAAQETARHRHSTTATTTAGTAYVATNRSGVQPLTAAPATWHYPAGTAHEQTVPVPAGTRAGDTVRIWVDDHGDAAPAPPTTSDLAVNAAGYGASVLCGIVLAAGAVVCVGRRIVDAHSAREWEAEWADVEPQWSGRLRPGQGTGDD
ncbi:Rv1733c family protein [Streptomyces sp. NPDC001272]|uniref:Rv1733c family protein n=1 Tax=Streptomyces sp. NPDC001674 TaxID=3154394 RepID=UPI00332B0C8A